MRSRGRKRESRGILSAMRTLFFGHRQGFLIVTALLVLTSCGWGADDPSRVSGSPTLTLADLPAGIGRGYPSAHVEGKNASGRIEVGQEAPDFHLQVNPDRYLRMQDLAGRPVLLNFWATWCGPCRLEMPEIVKATQDDPDLVVLAFNMMEERSQVEQFATEFAMAIPVVLDPEGSVANRYGVRGLPTSIFVDRQGKVAVIWAGVLTTAKLHELLAQVN